MKSIGEEAIAYEAPQTKNVADLDVVLVNAELVEKTYTDKEGNPFTMKVLTHNHEDYRVPISVLKALKDILEERPELKTFKVKKTGEGLKTSYTVIPIE
jgi:hypothetical protein